MSSAASTVSRVTLCGGTRHATPAFDGACWKARGRTSVRGTEAPPGAVRLGAAERHGLAPSAASAAPAVPEGVVAGYPGQPRTPSGAWPGGLLAQPSPMATKN